MTPLRFALLSTLGLTLACTVDEPVEAPSTMTPLAPPEPMIERAPAELQGRVALPDGARLYARPTYTSSSWELSLAEPPLGAGEELPRTRVFRVIGVVRDLNLGDFVAVTNDLVAEDEDPPVGCGQPLAGLDHLRMLLFVPRVYLAEVVAEPVRVEPLDLGSGSPEQLVVGAGARVGPVMRGGMPPPPEGASWRWVDADGIRALAAVPDALVARAWDPGKVLDAPAIGEPLLRDAEGAMMRLDDGGGASVELSLRNPCGDLRRVVAEPAEVESLRVLALDVFYDQSPSPDPAPPRPPDADFSIPANTPLRWTDGVLAGEVLESWPVEVGIGQTWDNRRCFALELGPELPPLDQAPLICVSPEALEPRTPSEAIGHFAVRDELELGGSVELEPGERTGPWTDAELRSVLNRHHQTSAECLRSLLLHEDEVRAARWALDLVIDEGGRVTAVVVEAGGESSTAVEDCLEVEASTWIFPPDAGELRVALSVGAWDGAEDPPEFDAPDQAAESEAEPEPEASEDPPRERGTITIIRDESP